MSDNETSRVSRLIAILTQLQTKRLLTATEISKKFNISIRTVYRDIRALQDAGVPICTEDGKGYSLMEGYRIPPVMFTENEVNALITAEQFILQNKDASLIKDYTEAIAKVKSVLRYTTRDKTELLSKRINVWNGFENTIMSNYLSSLQLAITNFNLLKIEYESLESNIKTVRIVEPFALYNTLGKWLFLAWCRLRKDYRTFRLDHIQKIDLLIEKFEPHKIDLRQYFEIQQKKYSNP